MSIGEMGWMIISEKVGVGVGNRILRIGAVKIGWMMMWNGVAV
jgi:hypothetical protein